MSSILFTYQPPLCVIPLRRRGPEQFVTAGQFLKDFGFEQSDHEEGQALRQCPNDVRVAIASHYLWWFLIRAHSGIVRTFAHSFLAACRAPCAAMNAVTDRINNDGTLRAGIVGTTDHYNRRPEPVMPYRVLHYFRRYLRDSSMTGESVTAMQAGNWDSWHRCGVASVGSDHRAQKDDNALVVGHLDHYDYDHATDNGAIVRSSASLWTYYKAGVISAFQPFFSKELLQTESNLDRSLFPEAGNRVAVTVPKLMVNKPRSKKIVAMIPNYLAHGMEQVAEEMPYLVRQIQGWSAYWNIVRDEIEKYIEAREQAALIAMAHRDSITAWLNQYDAIAVANYALPQVAGRNKPMSEGPFEFNAGKAVTLQFPGLCENRVQ